MTQQAIQTGSTGDAGSPLRILHLTAGSDAGGVSRYLFDLCMGLHQRGHEVTIAGERGSWHSLFHDAPWRWIELPLKHGYFALRRSADVMIRRRFDRPFDVIHAHYRKAAIAGRRIARACDIPMLFTLHLTGIPMNGLHRWFSDFGDHAHAPSVMAREWLERVGRVAADRISVIPHGLDPARFPEAGDDDKRAARLALGLPHDATICAFVGRFDEPKNEDWMLDFAEVARGEIPDLIVLLVGEGPHESRLREEIAARDLLRHVHILGYRDPLSVYHAIDALLLPSAQEGFSLVCLEAMSCGRPVLRTRTAGTQEMIVEQVTGVSVPVDREAFIEGALEFLTDVDALRTMGASAARHVRSRLTLDRQVDATAALYKKLAHAEK